MALVLDASSPAIVYQSASATVTTASFTPPANSLLVIGMAGNTPTGNSPAAPSVTDNLGVHLTYTLVQHSARPDVPLTDGQSTMYVATVATSAAMTVSMVNAVSAQEALKVWVFTDDGGGVPTLGANVEGAQASGGSANIAVSYTATANNSRGVIVVCDWTPIGAATAGTGTTLTGGGSTQQSAITYTYALRTTADGVAAATTTLNLTEPGTGASLHWVAAEIVPAATAASGYNVPSTARHPGRGPSSARFLPSRAGYSATATVYTQSLAGSVTPAGALTKQDQKALAGAATSSGALAKLAKKVLAGTATSSGALAKLASKALSGAATSSSALTKLVSKALAGASTPSGALTTIKVVLRSFAGSVASSGGLTRQTNKALSGTATPAGAVRKAVSRAFAGAVTATGALAKLVAKALTGSASSSGSVSATTVGATQNATSAPGVAASVASTPAVAANRTSSPGVTDGTTSTPTVSGG